MIRTTCTFAALLLLAGCDTAPKVPAARVAVPVECRVQVPDRPAMPTESLSEGVELDPLVAAALAEVDIREGYEVKLRAALAICTAPTTTR